MSLADMQKNIKHVVHLMLENRSFDTLLGWLYTDTDKPAGHVPPLRSNEQSFYGVPNEKEAWQPDHPSYFSGTDQSKHRPIIRGNGGRCFVPYSDPGEPWNDVTEQIYGPKKDMNLPPEKRMRGFWLNYNSQGPKSTDDILNTSTPEDLPVINTLAREFAVSDMWFSSAPTQTNPNRAFSLGGSSLGIKINGNTIDGTPFKDLATIFTVFNYKFKPVSAKVYADHYWIWTPPRKYYTEYMFPNGFHETNLGGSIEDFQNDVAHDNLPAFTYLEPTFGGELELTWGNDYHPFASYLEGETFLKKIYDTLLGNPAVFEKTLFIVTFDEHGGCYDHITPPTNAPVPDKDSAEFSRYGVRVPTLLISPWVKRGTVFRGPWYPEGPGDVLPYDHTSVLATLMKWQGIPYSFPGKRGYLRQRTVVAPTFEDVITNQKTTVWPKLTLPKCNDAVPLAVAPRNAIHSAVTRFTGFPLGDPQHERIVADLEANVKTREQMMAELRKLVAQYADRPR